MTETPVIERVSGTRQTSATRVTPQANTGSANNAAQGIDDEYLALAAVIELQCELDQAETLEQACHRLADALREILDAGHAVVLWCDRPDSPMRVMAESSRQPSSAALSLSELASPADASHAGRSFVLAAAEELAIHGGIVQTGCDETTDVPSGDAGSVSVQPATMAIGQYIRSRSARTFVGGCLTRRDGNLVGCVLLLDCRRNSAARFVDAVSPLMGIKLDTIRRRQPTATHAVVQSLNDYVRSRRSRWMMMWAAAIALLMFAPAKYTVDADLEIQPVQRRYVAAPLDGPLAKCHVRPGDVVAAGDVLAEIDSRELEFELAGVRSQWNQAELTKKENVAKQDFAAGRLGELESERLRLKSELLELRRGELQIRSPISGMIVSGDWRSNEGMPLSRGETLFEVAPLSEMLVELWVPESEIRHVRAGMTVRFYSHAAADVTRVGKIVHVHPQAEIRENENVFLAEVRMANPDAALQPGMRGRATIYSDAHAIGWNLFHRPWHALLNRIGF